MKNQSTRTNNIKSALAFFGLGLAFVAGTEAASLIGAGAIAGGTLQDSAGGRTNVDRNFRYLPAGTYHVNDFNFNGVTTDGTVQPFLSSSTVPLSTYTPVWTGSAGSAAIGTNTVTYTPGSQQFTLAVPTRIYSGFAMTANAVGFATGGATDHNGAPALTPVVGTALPTFSNLNLGRTYSSGLNVTNANPLTSGRVGAGAGILSAGQQDTPGQDRLNVDLLFITLSAGTYRVSDWELNVFDNAQPGTITPMLLTRSSTNYTTLWLGSALDPSANGAQSVAENGFFTLTDTTEVYAGFFTQGGGSGLIALDSSNAGAGNLSLTDHDTAFTAPAGLGEAVGGISNPALARTYAFGINTVLIPEPGSLGLLALGGLAALVRRRKRVRCPYP